MNGYETNLGTRAILIKERVRKL